MLRTGHLRPAVLGFALGALAGEVLGVAGGAWLGNGAQGNVGDGVWMALGSLVAGVGVISAIGGDVAWTVGLPVLVGAELRLLDQTTSCSPERSRATSPWATRE